MRHTIVGEQGVSVDMTTLVSDSIAFHLIAVHLLSFHPSIPPKARKVHLLWLIDAVFLRPYLKTWFSLGASAQAVFGVASAKSK